MHLGLPPQRGGILAGAQSALSTLPVTVMGNTGLSMSPAAHGKRPSTGKGESARRETVRFYPFLLTEMLAFVQRKTFHVSAA